MMRENLCKEASMKGIYNYKSNNGEIRCIKEVRKRENIWTAPTMCSRDFSSYIVMFCDLPLFVMIYAFSGDKSGLRDLLPEIGIVAILEN